MKTIYINPTTFACSVEKIEDYLVKRTDVFDGMSDQDIELYRFVPEGYKWVDELTGESFTGQAVMPIDSGERALIKELQQADSVNAQTAAKNSADITYISMMTGVNLDE